MAAAAANDDAAAVITALSPPSLKEMLLISAAQLMQLHAALQAATGDTMLPSFIFQHPTGREAGVSVALDLGGSTFRVAVIRLVPGRGRHGHEYLAREAWGVDDDVKSLPSARFFDWVAEHVAEVLERVEDEARPELVGVTWSFPIVQTSLSSGNIQKMGKGFRTHEGIVGTDLRGHFEAAFRRKGMMTLRMNALMNDTEATLLSHAYENPDTRISLICGTGTNAALQLPVSAVAEAKLGARSDNWSERAKVTLVNTECSMFGGGGVFPVTNADKVLDANQIHPGFQPFEQLVGGRYLGEVCRITLVELVSAAGGGEKLFAGVIPKGLEERFSLDTVILGAFEKDETVDEGVKLFSARYACELTSSDIVIISGICRAISRRAAAYLAIMVFSLWRLQRDAFEEDRSVNMGVLGAMRVAYCGAVLEKHPSIRMLCQKYLDELVNAELFEAAGGPRKRLILEHADDSGLLGAAVGSVVNGELSGSRL